MAGKYDHIDFKPPKSVADAAARGLELRQKAKKSHKGGLSTGQAAKEGVGSGVQRAVNLKNRSTMSPETVRRMLRFFQRHEKNKKIDKGKTALTDKGYQAWCLAGDTQITLADGTQMSIANICESDEDIHVLTYNEATGQLEPKLVTDKITNDATPDEFYRLSLGQGTHTSRSTTRNANLWLTGEHKVFTDNHAWVSASELGEDKVWRLSYAPTDATEQIVLGTLLGDGSIDKAGILKFAHTSAQKEYAAMKATALGARFNITTVHPNNKSYNKKTMTVMTGACSLGAYGVELRNKLYGTKKEVSRSYLDSLGELGIACWFFDDGSLHKENSKKVKFCYRLHTEGFNLSSIANILDFFRDMGYSCKSYKRENCDGHVIYFNAESSAKISRAIAAYATQDLQYKLLPEHRSAASAPTMVPSFDLGMFKSDHTTTEWKSLGHSVRKANRRRLMKKYDLTVEGNHNFFANGVLVHNCIWGGDPGYAWARKIVRQMDAADRKAKASITSAVSLLKSGAAADLGFYDAHELVVIANALDQLLHFDGANTVDQAIQRCLQRKTQTHEGAARSI